MNDDGYSDLPDPLSPIQRMLMGREIAAECERLERGGANQFVLYAEVMDIVGKWAARAGRLYASNRIDDLREEFLAREKELQAAHSETQIELAALRELVEVLRAQLHVVEIRRDLVA